MSQKKILVYTKYSKSGPSSRYRYYNYVGCFKKHTLNVSVSPFFTDKYLANNNPVFKILLSAQAYLIRLVSVLKLVIFPSSYKLVIIEYELLPYLSSLFERLLKLRKIPYIVDYDDAIFHRYDQHKNPLVRFLLKNKISKVMSYASAVVVGNNYLHSYARKFNNRIIQLPTVVLLDKYQEAIKKHEMKPLKPPEDPFVIGWIGSKTTSPYVLNILPAIEKFTSMYQTECHFIGFDDSLISKEMQDSCNITILPWSEETEVQEIMDFDVGIMPLRDDPWSKGKCGFKLIQYMSCKKSVIASPVGVNQSIVKDEINGYLATSIDQWFTALEKLYRSNELRQSMGENNWKKILKEYNHQVNCDKYVELAQEILGKYSS